MRILSNFFLLLGKKNYSKVYFIIFLILVLTLFELLGIALVLPLMTLILSPEKFQLYTADLLFFENLHSIDSKLLLTYFCVFFFFVFLIKNIFIIISNNYIHKFVYNFRTNTYVKLLNLYLHQKYIFFSKRSFVTTSNTLNVEINNLAHNFLRPCLYMFAELMIFISIIVFALILGYYKVILLGIIFVFISTFFLKSLNKKIKNSSQERINKNENIVKSTQQIILGIKEILLSGNIKKITDNFKNNQTTLEKIDVSVSVKRLLPRGFLEMLVALLLIISIVYFSKSNQKPEEFFILLSFYLAAAYRILPSLNTIFVSYQQIKFGIPSLNKVLSDLKLEKDLIYIDNKQSFELKRRIKLQNVSFSFSKRKELFKNINFEINKNEVVGIYGESGSGKSTLLNIICKLYDPDSGDIIIDDTKIEGKDFSAKYRNLFSYISQDSFLMESTILNNITFESEDKINYDKLKYAIEFSQLKMFIDSLQKGLETEISAIQKNISSGQRQRITIARMIYNSRNILIFDEATNALDEETEKKIIERIVELKKNRTIIIVSHNKENLKKCDKVYQIIQNTIIPDAK